MEKSDEIIYIGLDVLMKDIAISVRATVSGSGEASVPQIRKSLPGWSASMPKNQSELFSRLDLSRSGFTTFSKLSDFQLFPSMSVAPK
jgi:hypothetical protein